MAESVPFRACPSGGTTFSVELTENSSSVSAKRCGQLLRNACRESNALCPGGFAATMKVEPKGIFRKPLTIVHLSILYRAPGVFLPGIHTGGQYYLVLASFDITTYT